MKSTRSELQKTSKIIQKVQLSTKLSQFEKIRFFLRKIVQFRVDLRFDNDIYQICDQLISFHDGSLHWYLSDNTSNVRRYQNPPDTCHWNRWNRRLLPLRDPSKCRVAVLHKRTNPWQAQRTVIDNRKFFLANAK